MKKQIHIFLFLFLGMLFGGLPLLGQKVDFVIKMTTTKQVGEKIGLKLRYSSWGTLTDETKPSITSVTGIKENLSLLVTDENFKQPDYYTLTDQTITIRGSMGEDTHFMLVVPDNELTELDVSDCPRLWGLYCHGNNLKSLNLAGQTLLDELDCSNNQLTELDLKDAGRQETFSAGRKETFSIFYSLNCSNNQLTALDLSGKDNIYSVYCYGNQIKEEEMSKLVNSLPVCYEDVPPGKFVVVRDDSSEGNRCLKEHVDIAKSKRWTVLKTDLTNGDIANGKYREILYDGISFTNVTLTKEGEGTLNATGAEDLNAVTVGTELTIIATPAEGYELTALTANGQDILATKKVVVNGVTEIKATFTKKSYTVTFTPEGEGENKLTATRNGEPFTSGSPAHEGDKIVITAQPAEGYQIDKWLIGTEEIEFTPYTGQTIFECTVGTVDVLIKATFAKKSFAVTLTKDGEGTINATGAEDLNAVAFGTELTIEASPAEGYELTALTANGQDILATKTVMVKEATEVKATFVKKSFAVTLTKDGEGTLNATGAEDINAVAFGTELTIEATPAEGYELTALTANGQDILATKKVVVKEATEVKVTFAKKTATALVDGLSIRLYPNPATEYANVDGAKANALLRLYDINGMLLYEGLTNAQGMLKIDLSGYAEGIYLVVVEGQAKRLLIER